VALTVRQYPFIYQGKERQYGVFKFLCLRKQKDVIQRTTEPYDLPHRRSKSPNNTPLCLPAYSAVQSGAGHGGGRPGEKGAGGEREAGEEGAGSGIPKVAGSGRKKEKLRNIAQYFAIE